MDPVAQMGYDLGNWIWVILQTDENEVDRKGNPTFNAKMKKTFSSVSRSVEFSSGLGQGIYAEFELFDFGAAIGMYGNYGTVNYSDGMWKTGQEVYVGASIAPVQWFELGFGDYTFLQGGKATDSSRWSGINDTQESWTIFSAACYPLFFGGSIEIGFDLNSFLADIDEIWGLR